MMVVYSELGKILYCNLIVSLLYYETLQQIDLYK